MKKVRLQTKLAPQQTKTLSWGPSTRNLIALIAMILLATFAVAQTPIPASSQFDITGFIQSATLGGPGTGPGVGAHQGGVIIINGQVVIVPSETIVILPANALTWQELFALAPAPYTGVATGMALADIPAPLTTYEARIVGNRVIGGPGGPDVYIAGLIWISQQALNNGQGFINCINYATGEIRVGGPLGNCAAGTRIRLNDPLNAVVGTGRYGRPISPDIRFMVDQDNPTIRSVSGFPMCIPRVLADPNIAGNPDDALCPKSQRPAAVAPATGFASLIQMNNPVALPGVPPNATIQAPFEVGDWVTFAGTVVADPGFTAGPTAGPWPGLANTYISAHTLVNNVAIYTWPGTNPAYTAIDVSFVGTGGLTVVGANEAAIMTRFEGFSTDTSRYVHLYGIDLNPTTGATSDRDWGTIGVDPGPANGAATGRWRYRPPCGLTAPDPTNFKDCTGPPSNSYLPPTREVRAVVQGAWTPAGPQTTYANGIVAGQYHSPIADYRFPENLPGNPIVENNFNSIPFLSSGGYTSSTGTLVGVLNPWPSNAPPPPPACTTAPVVNAGGPYTVASGGSITLNGSATGDVPITFAWTAPAQGTISPLSAANATYTAPFVAVTTVVPVQLSATSCGGTGTANGTITINSTGAPTVNSLPQVHVFSGAAGNFTVTGSDPNGLPLTFNIVQTGAPALLNFVVTQGPNPPANTANATFNAAVLPLGQVLDSVINITVTATNSAGVTSAPMFTTVCIEPLADLVAVQTAIYRVNNRRLIITATSSVVSANVVLTLQPYVTTTGTTYNPDPAAGGVGNVFTNLGGGLYSLTINGVPEPACGNPAGNFTPCPTKPMDVKSNLGGDSGFFALTKVQ
jgi:hypothetical protein